MNLSEIREKFVTELSLKPTINSARTVKSYLSAFDKFTSENSRFYRMSEEETKIYLASIRENYSDSYFNVIGSVMKVAFGVVRQPRKMDWFKPISTKPNFGSIVSYDEFVQMGKRCNNIKHKLILVLLYSTGVRAAFILSPRHNWCVATVTCYATGIGKTSVNCCYCNRASSGGNKSNQSIYYRSHCLVVRTPCY